MKRAFGGCVYSVMLRVRTNASQINYIDFTCYQLFFRTLLKNCINCVNVLLDLIFTKTLASLSRKTSFHCRNCYLLKLHLPPTTTLTFFFMKLNAFPLIVKIVPPAWLPFLGSTLTTSGDKINSTFTRSTMAEILFIVRVDTRQFSCFLLCFSNF